MDKFIGLTLGKEAQNLYEIIIDDPIKVSQSMQKAIKNVTKNRQKLDDAYYYNWSLHIDEKFQHSFNPTHENMNKLNLTRNQPVAEFASDLRRAFSGIVAGNVKPAGIQAIKDHGTYKLTGEPEIMQALDKLLTSFKDQKRMKISGEYIPCYELTTS